MAVLSPYGEEQAIRMRDSMKGKYRSGRTSANKALSMEIFEDHVEDES